MDRPCVSNFRKKLSAVWDIECNLLRADVYSPESEAENCNLIRGYSQGFGHWGVVDCLKVTSDLVPLGADRQQTTLVLDVPYLKREE